MKKRKNQPKYQLFIHQIQHQERKKMYLVKCRMLIVLNMLKPLGTVGGKKVDFLSQNTL